MDGLLDRSATAEVAASSRRPRIVIIGAGFGGLSTATRLGHVDADVTVIDRHNHHLFQPLLYQVATAALSPADIAAPVRSIRKCRTCTPYPAVPANPWVLPVACASMPSA